MPKISDLASKRTLGKAIGADLQKAEGQSAFQHHMAGPHSGEGCKTCSNRGGKCGSCGGTGKATGSQCGGCGGSGFAGISKAADADFECRHCHKRVPSRISHGDVFLGHGSCPENKGVDPFRGGIAFGPHEDEFGNKQARYVAKSADGVPDRIHVEDEKPWVRDWAIHAAGVHNCEKCGGVQWMRVGDDVKCLNCKHVDQGLAPKIVEVIERAPLSKRSDDDYQPDEDDIYFSPSGHLGSRTSVSAGGKHIGEFKSDGEARKAARDWSHKNNYFPNAWSVSDHGNHELVRDLHRGCPHCRKPRVAKAADGDAAPQE